LKPTQDNRKEFKDEGDGGRRFVAGPGGADSDNRRGDGDDDPATQVGGGGFSRHAIQGPPHVPEGQ